MHHEGKKKGNTISSSNTKGLGAWTGGDPGEASLLSRGEREGSKGDWESLGRTEKDKLPGKNNQILYN